MRTAGLFLVRIPDHDGVYRAYPNVDDVGKAYVNGALVRGGGYTHERVVDMTKTAGSAGHARVDLRECQALKALNGCARWTGLLHLSAAVHQED